MSLEKLDGHNYRIEHYSVYIVFIYISKFQKAYLDRTGTKNHLKMFETRS